MHRRTVLVTAGGTLAGSLAGCISNTDGSDSSTPTPDPSTTSNDTPRESTEETRHRTVSVETQDAVPNRHQVSLNVEVIESAVTAAHTAHLRITMTNEGPERAFKVGPDDCNLFNRNRAGSDDPTGLWLYLPKETEYLDRKGEKWVPDRPQSQSRAYNTAACALRTYESGESVRTEYEVWHDYQVDGYLDPDTYRWEEDVEIWEDTEARYNEPPTETFTWGFSLSVTDAK